MPERADEMLSAADTLLAVDYSQALSNLAAKKEE